MSRIRIAVAPIIVLEVMLGAGCDQPDGGALATPAPAPRPEPWLVEITDDVGLDFVHESGGIGGFVLPETMGAGAAMFDYDGDGDLDLYLTSGHTELGRADTATGSPNRLYRQDPDGSFTDVTAESGLGDEGYGMGMAIGDIDNDGDLDVYVTNFGPDALYLNAGDGTFGNVTTAAGIDNPGWSCSAAFLDYDRDGFLDLFLTQYVEMDLDQKCFDEAGRPEYCGPLTFPAAGDVLLHNDGNGTFTDVSKAAGILDANIERGAGLGVTVADFTHDGWVDIYVANDAYANHLWVNQGNGTFIDASRMMGTAYNFLGQAEAGMGVVAADFNNDLRLDLFVTHLALETNTLYVRDEFGFTDTTGLSGLGTSSMRETGFGADALDLDQDGLLDLVVVNGRVNRGDPLPGTTMPPPWDLFAEPNFVYVNEGGGRFGDACDQTESFCAPIELTRGLATGDVDGDGDLDILINNVQGPARLYRNQVPGQGHWLMVDAQDPALHRTAIGAQVTVAAGGKPQVRVVTRAGSYNSSRDPRAHFGLGENTTVDVIEVLWPDGMLERFAGVAADQVVVVRRGEGIARR